jgi:hypothetical protein
MGPNEDVVFEERTTGFYAASGREQYGEGEGGDGEGAAAI